MALIATHTQQPADTLDYDVTYEDWLEAGDAVESATATVAPAGLDVVVLIASPIVKLWVSEGVDKTTYKITLTTTTVDGRVKQDEIRIKVKDY